MKRSREVAIRKTVGAFRRLLVIQFLFESFVFTLLAHIMTIFLVELSLDFFNRFLNLQLSIPYFSGWFILGLLVSVIFTGLLAGSYPAVFLSSFRPITIMRGLLSTGQMNIAVRRILVVIQFGISIALVIVMLTIYKQIHYMRHSSLGFEPDNKIVLRFPRNHVVYNNYQAIKQDFKSIPEVENLAFSSTVPGQWNYVWRTYLPGQGKQSNILMNWYAVDEDFIEVMGFKLIAGKPHASEMNWNNIIINEEAVKAFEWGLPDDAIQKKIWDESNNVIGVIQNFHFKGLQSEIEPMGMFRITDDFKYLIINPNTTNLSQTLEELKRVFRMNFPYAPFYYFFLDEDFNKQYHAEATLSRLFTGLTLIGLVIACLGLLGLASFMGQQKTKEIGIRKVNGATLKVIIVMMAKDFTRWVLLANLIAWPLAYLFIRRWLHEFAYHIPNNLWLYLLAGGSVLIIALSAVSFQAWKAAMENPVKALKYE